MRSVILFVGSVETAIDSANP